MIFLILWVKSMRGADATDLLHHGRISARRISQESPVCTTTAIDDVINRSGAQF